MELGLSLRWHSTKDLYFLTLFYNMFQEDNLVKIRDNGANAP